MNNCMRHSNGSMIQLSFARTMYHTLNGALFCMPIDIIKLNASLSIIICYFVLSVLFFFSLFLSLQMYSIQYKLCNFMLCLASLYFALTPLYWNISRTVRHTFSFDACYWCCCLLMIPCTPETVLHSTRCIGTFTCTYRCTITGIHIIFIRLFSLLYQYQ